MLIVLVLVILIVKVLNNMVNHSLYIKEQMKVDVWIEE